MSDNNNIRFQDDGSPFSEEFDDIYFDTESGCQQSEQVFIKGNNIADRLVSTKTLFTIAETGFGTGLNFLLTLALVDNLRAKHDVPTLHFITTEKYPLTRNQLRTSHACLPQLSKWSEQLITQYPTHITDNQSLTFLDGLVTLTILLGDATESFSQLTSNKKGIIDAWYLDGFSPSKNPAMWQPALFEQLGRLSKDNASVATFTVAGIVRRGLSDNGFRVARKAYDGKKKEILIGNFQQSTRLGKAYQLRPVRNKPQHVTIIGGGIASACLAYHLIQQDIKVTLYCKDEQIAQGASANRIGALYPLIHQRVDDLSLFYQQALQHARQFYQNLLTQGADFSHQWCGLLELSFNDNLRQRQQGIEQSNVWPTSLIKSVDKFQASQLANMSLEHGGLYIPNAGWLAPQEVITAIFKLLQTTGKLKIKYNVNIDSITQLADNKWQLTSNKGLLKASNLVIATGAETLTIAPLNQLPIQPVKGQVSCLPANKQTQDLSTVICHKGYLTPANNKLHCIGATFDKTAINTNTDSQADEYNLAMLSAAMNTTFGWQLKDIVERKARLRCMTPDHMPISGPMADIEPHKALYNHLAKDKNWRYDTPAPYLANLYVLTGLGARGLCSAPLLSEILTADICGTPYPVDNQMLFNVSSNRFIVRDIIKRKVSVNR